MARPSRRLNFWIAHDSETMRVLARKLLFPGGVILNRGLVEDRDVGKVSGLQLTAVGDCKSWHTCEAAKRFNRRKDF